MSCQDRHGPNLKLRHDISKCKRRLIVSFMTGFAELPLHAFDLNVSNAVQSVG